MRNVVSVDTLSFLRAVISCSPWLEEPSLNLAASNAVPTVPVCMYAVTGCPVGSDRRRILKICIYLLTELGLSWQHVGLNHSSGIVDPGSLARIQTRIPTGWVDSPTSGSPQRSQALESCCSITPAATSSMGSPLGQLVLPLPYAFNGEV